MTPDSSTTRWSGCGGARKLVFSYGGNPGVGSLHRFRDAVEHGWPRPLEIEEHCHAGMANRYAAGAAGLPFALMRGYVGTDLATRTTRQRDRPARSPARARRGARAEARRRDRPRAGGRPRAATCSSGASPACRRRRCWPRERSLVTVERIVDELEPRPGGVVIPGWVIDAVAEAPGGSQPSYALGLTDARQRLLPRWDAISRDRDAFTAWMDEHVLEAAGDERHRATTRRPPARSRRVAAARRAARRAGRASSASAARAPRRSSPARTSTTPTSCSSTSRARSAPSRRSIPLSIGDGELAETADAVVSVPEMFNYWIGARADRRRLPRRRPGRPLRAT